MRRREFIAGLGAAAVWPVAARAQQTTTMPVIGYLDSNAAASKAPPLEALRAGLADAGYVEGKNLAIEYRWAAFDSRRLPELAADLVQRQVAAIVTYGARAPILAAKAATSTIPIIFIYAGDPVTDGLITSLSRPGGNLTGVTSFSRDVAGKRLDLLLKTVPQATTIGFLSGTPAFVSYEQQTSQMFTAAGALGLKLTVVECRSDRDFETAFAALVERRAEALILGTFPLCGCVPQRSQRSRLRRGPKRDGRVPLP
jgi:putative ABC transport system substrate-binding protein